jgi:diguanylate cyclase (GGDEF)-like protein/PAS domain S-box-containing protein
MNFQFVPYSTLFFGASVLCAGIAIIVWKRRRFQEGALLFIGLMIAVSEWSFSAGMEAISVGIDAKVLWSKILYFAVISTAPLLLLFSITYTQLKKILKLHRVILLFLIPVFILIMTWTNESHKLIWSDFTFGSADSNVLIYHRGPLYWLSVSYSYIIVIISFLIFLHAFLQAKPPIKQQFGLMMLSIAVPLLLSSLYISRWDALEGMDITPLSFTITGFLLAWSLIRFRFLDLIPVGRSIMVDKMPMGMLVLDEKNRIADINSAAIKLLSLEGRSLTGIQIESVLQKKDDLMLLLSRKSEEQAEIYLSGKAKRFLDVQISLLKDRNRKIKGKLVLMQDITQRKKMEDELVRLAATDSLTGINNRRSFMDKIVSEFTKSNRYDRPLSFAWMDIDHFKKINDKYGHKIGDEALKEVVNRCLSNIREADDIGRLGGEEIGIFFPETEIDGAVVVCERMRARISDFPFIINANKIRLSVSIGIAQMSRQDKNADELINRADKALYEAKRKGRNRIAIAKNPSHGN